MTDMIQEGYQKWNVTLSSLMAIYSFMCDRHDARRVPMKIFKSIDFRNNGPLNNDYLFFLIRIVHAKAVS